MMKFLQCNKARKRNRIYIYWGGRNKTVFAHGMIIYIKNSKVLTKKSKNNLKLLSNYGRIEECKRHIQKSVAFLYNMN